jgi:hypothetical protein
MDVTCDLPAENGHNNDVENVAREDNCEKDP